MIPATVIVVGASLGGSRALESVLGALPADFQVPVLVVLHRGKGNQAGLRQFLQGSCPLSLHEPEDKEVILAGHVYLAPADYHMLVDRDCVALTTDAPVNYARPSVDVLFESAAAACGPGVIGVVLTGGGCDGARGALSIHERGGHVIVQDPATAEDPAMPAAVLEVVPEREVLPLQAISGALAAIAMRESPR